MIRSIFLGAFCALVAVCGSDEEAVPVVTAAAPSAVVAVPAPSHGGTVVAAGRHHVEVVPRRDGMVQAYVVGSAPPPQRTRMTVQVPADDGRRHSVMLVYDPAQHYYVGNMRRVHPVAGPVQVAMVVDGHHYVGHAPTVVIAGPIVVVDPHPVVIVGGRHDNGLHLGHYRGRGHWGHGHGHFGHGHGGHVRVHVH